MTTMNGHTTVAELVTERPGRARVFERYGIDFCCGGRRPLSEACAARGLDTDEVLAALRQADEAGGDESETDWDGGSLTALADHIVETHHTYLRNELPRLSLLAEKVARVHGERHPELNECREVFFGLRDELESHMAKEECILFPLIRELETGATRGDFHCGVDGPIAVMEHEHAQAGAALEQLRTLTGGYRPPTDACNSYRVLFDGWADLERDLHRHIHKENNILFPRAAALYRART